MNAEETDKDEADKTSRVVDSKDRLMHVGKVYFARTGSNTEARSKLRLANQ